MIPKPVSWFSEAVIYHIVIDRFAGYQPHLSWRKPAFMGGNLKGIIDKADYLAELGVNTVWLSPLCSTSAYHGYHITDFYQAEPRFGSMEEVVNLLNTFHKKNIRVILDFVANHCAASHPYFCDAMNDRRSKYRKWFYFKKADNKYLTFLHYNDLPKINLNCPEAFRHITESAKFWLSLGFNGLRLDHVVGPSNLFWRAFSSEVKKQFPEAVLIGEAWLEGVRFRHLPTLGIQHKYSRWIFGLDPADVQLEYKNSLDGVLDFYFRHRITEFIAWKQDYLAYKGDLQRAMEKHYARFPAGFFLPSFIDNHDMNRFLFDCGQDLEKLKAALAFQFSLPQPPVIYYGTETGLSHTEPIGGDVPPYDLPARKPMPWSHLNYDLIGFVKQLIAQRFSKRSTH